MTNLPFAADSCARDDSLAATLQQMGVHETYGADLLRLVKATARTYENVLADRMRSEGMSGPRWRLLVGVWMAERTGAGSVSPTELSHLQSLSKNTISSHLRTLEEQGLIRRELDPEDLRQFRIRLTEVGRHQLYTSTPGHMAFLNALAADLTPEEIAMLQRLLCRLYSSVCRHAGAAEDGTLTPQMHTDAE